MNNTIAIFKREFAGYFGTPVAAVFIFIFLLFLFGLTFFFGFYTGEPTDQADLQRFFFLHPWIFLFFIPAISMRLWSEERRVGTVELLMTLPVTTFQAVIGKFLAAWCFAGLALLLTTSVWMTVNYLGEPDNGVILAGYIGSLFMAGAYLAIGAFASALTKNQVISLVLSVLICAGFVFAGTDMVTDPLGVVLPAVAIDTIRSFSFLTHFDGITKGLIDLRDLIFFGSLMICFLLANAIVIDFKKAA
jgi:ABC-2 type transport system permease protein